MCGIIGGNNFPNEKQVVKGLQTLMHRGTDGNVIFSFNDNMYLSHNRLSIQDLSETANQPMISDDSRFYLAFNGELWKTSFDKFDKKLRKLYNFKTKKSDSELLLYYLIHNLSDLPSALRELDGMFCFSLYDKVEDTTYLGRDFIGRLPLYYVYKNNRFSFSSEAKGLMVGLDDEYYKIDVKNPKYVPIHKWREKESIHPVLPGTIIKFSPNKFIDDGGYTMEEIRWYNFKHTEYDKDNQSYYTRTEEEFIDFDSEDKGLDYYVNGFRNVLEEAVDNETISDVPICTILSGGIDSTIITYLLSKKYPNMEAFVVNVNPTRKSKVKDDLYYARMAAKEFGIKLHEVNVERDEIDEVLEESVWASETYKWTQVSPAVAQLFLAWEIRDKGYKVVFGGEGADEIFASYGDVKRFCWNQPIHWHQKRINLLNGLHKSNLVRTNKAMMYGGKVELRTPFLNKEVIDFGLQIPTKYRDENHSQRDTIDVFDTKHKDGNVMKFILRKAFENDISEELLWRPKKTFQVGCHTDYLRKEQDRLDKYFTKLFIKRKGWEKYTKRNFGHTRARIKIEEIENN
tara:strand:- start:316 stop:2028 length:1713 start_codon:yes stop_codon:yes gene_type:complete